MSGDIKRREKEKRERGQMSHDIYQSVYPPSDPPVAQFEGFWVTTTFWPDEAAIWAEFGAQPGGGGGMVGGFLLPNRAPASKPPLTTVVCCGGGGW